MPIRSRLLGVIVFLASTLVTSCGSTTTTATMPGVPRTTEDYKRDLVNVLGQPHVAFLDADERCSCVVVGVTTQAAEAAAQSYALSHGVPATALRIVVTRPIVMLASLREVIRPVRGGLQIQNADQDTCTMAATVFARARGTKGLITASHCTKSLAAADGTAFYQAGGNFLGSDRVATEVVDPPLTATMPGCPSGRVCRRSDAAYAEFADLTTGIVGQLSMPTEMCFMTRCGVSMASQSSHLDIVGVAGAPTEGAHLGKIGRTSGWTQGLVTRTCIDVNVVEDSGADTGITLLCQHMVDAFSAHGDSGAPVFELLQHDRVVLAGILWGGANDSSSFLFSALPDVEAELGAFDFF